MENKINGSCSGRGCHITILPWDKLPNNVYSKMFRTRYDIKKNIFILYLSLDKKLATKR